jgi:zinc protease
MLKRFNLNCYWLYYLLFLSFLLSSVSVYCKSFIHIYSWETTYGAKVLFANLPELPIININVLFNAGSSQDGVAYGLANFTNAMLSEGTKSLSADQIAEAFAKQGAQFSSLVNRDYTILSLRSLSKPKLFTAALQTFNTIISEPLFSNSTFKRIREQLLLAIAQQNQQPGTIAENTFYANLYNKNPYGHTIYGNENTLNKITTHSLRKFHETFYTAKNATIIIVGDISIEKAKAVANDITKRLPGNVLKQPIKMVVTTSKLGIKEIETNNHEIFVYDGLNINCDSKLPTQHRIKLKKIYFPSEQTHIYIGQNGIAKTDPDYFPLLIANYIFGQAPLTSQLFQEIRNKYGLVYNISSNFIALKAQGPFVIYLQTSNGQTEKAINYTLKTLENFLCNCINDANLKLAKESLIGQLPLQIAGNADIAKALSTIGFYNLPLTYFDTYIENINAVTLEQMKAAFKRHINIDNLLIITVGKK